MLHENDGYGNGVGRWGRVPLWWIGALRGKPNAMLVAVCLACHADGEGKAWPSAEAIAAVTGIRRDRVFAALGQLKAARIIVASQPSPRRPTTHWLNFTVPDAGTQDVGTHTSDGKGTEERALGVPIARSGNKDQQIINRGSPRAPQRLAAQTDALADHLLDTAIAQGFEFGHLALDRRKWRLDNRDYGLKLVEAYGLELCKLRAVALVSAMKSGRITSRQIGTGLLFRCWAFRELSAAKPEEAGLTFDEMMGVA